MGLPGCSGLWQKSYSVVQDLFKRGEISKERFDNYKMEFKANDMKKKDPILANGYTYYSPGRFTNPNPNRTSGLGDIGILEARGMVERGEITIRTLYLRAFEIASAKDITAARSEAKFLSFFGEDTAASIINEVADGREMGRALDFAVMNPEIAEGSARAADAEAIHT